MSKTRPVAQKNVFQVKPVRPATIAAIVLEELSHDYGDVCNYLEAAGLARAGQFFLAVASIEQQNAGREVSSPRQHWVQSQGLAVLKKLQDPDVDQMAPTRADWFRTESRMRKMNQKFTAMANRHARGEKSIPYATEMQRFREALLFALGDAPPVEDIVECAHYGPGSTTEVRGREVHYVRKVEANDCTPLAIGLAAQALAFDRASWAHVGMDPVYATSPDAREGFLRVVSELLAKSGVTHDRLMFIHKNMTSLRSICAQPTCSGMLQLGVHSVMVPILHRVGIDLTDQGKNQRFARQGSRDWESPNPIVTLDLTNASSRIANVLVQVSLPPAWSKLLMRIRTPGYTTPDSWGSQPFDYEMYAGMGNGTTFAVESLIFWAATYATSEATSVLEYITEGQYAVYGDDVAIRRDHAMKYIPFAEYLGFKFNTKKTFLDGPFRESCGHDYYGGVWVTPATLRADQGIVSPEQLVGFHNTLADNPTYRLPGACKRIREVYRKYVSQVLPTDPSGNLGFRPVDVPHYDLVRKNGVAVVSVAWQRPRTYVLEVKTKMAHVGKLDHWSQIAIALLRARQSMTNVEDWSLPLRDATTVKVVPEKDLNRDDLTQMLVNQLCRLAVHKASPWWETCHGAVGHR